MAQRYEVKLRKLASKDLDSILHYALTNYSRESASKTYSVIEDKFQDIGKMPTAFPLYRTVSGELYFEVRWTIAKKIHKVFFTIDEAHKIVNIERIRHIKSSEQAILRALEEE